MVRDGLVNLELKTPGELLDEIVRLRKALEAVAAARMPGEARRIAHTALADQPKGEG